MYENTINRSLSLSQSLTEFLSGSGKRWIAVIEAYFDESGTHVGARITCVAGYVGDRERWENFEDEWTRHLQKHGIDCFHTKDPRCEILKSHLVKTILDCDLKGVVVSVNQDEYKHYTSATFRSTIGNAYSACAFGCGVHIQAWKWVLENDLREQKKLVSIILEAGQVNASYVRRVFEAMIENPSYPIVAVSVATKKEYLPLQAADFLAHSISTGNKKWMKELDRTQNLFCAHFNKRQMEEASKEVKSMISYQRNVRRKARKINVS